MSESDGVDDLVEGALRVAVTAGFAVAERRARSREAQLREASRKSADEWQQVTQRQRAQRNIAGGQLMMTVGQPGWLDKASPEEIQWAWETASTWREYDTRVEDYAKTIEAKLLERGVDVRDQVPGAAPGVASVTLTERLDRVRADGQQDVASASDAPIPPLTPKSEAEKKQATKPLTTVEEKALADLIDLYGPDWAGRGDLPKLVEVTTGEGESEQYHAVPIERLREWEERHKEADRADLQANAPLLRDPPQPVPGLPSVTEMMEKLQPVPVPAAFSVDEHRARLDKAGITDVAAKESVVLAGAHQRRPTAQVPVVAGQKATRQPKKPAKAVPVAERDQHRGR